MSVIFKAKLKSAKTAIAEKNYDYAYDLCHDLLEMDSSNYNIHILLGVSCQNMEKWDEGERVYNKAMTMPKANILAWQGMCALYEASKNQQKYVNALIDLRERYLSEESYGKAWETMHKLILLSEESGDQRRLVSILRELTDTGAYHSLLSVVDADPAPPSLAELLERMYNIERTLDERTVDSEINKRKTRLGAGPIAKVRKDVTAEVWAQSSLLNTLRQLVSVCEKSGQVPARLQWLEQLFQTLLERFAVIDALQDKQSFSEELLAVATDLAAAETCQSAFGYLIELSDASSEARDLRALIESYARLFAGGELRESALAWIATEDGSHSPEALALARAGCQRAPESPFAHVQLVRAAVLCKEYRLAVSSSNAAREAVQKFGDCFGTHLWRSMLAIDMSAADANTHIGPENAADAEYLYRKCLEVDPGNPRAILGLGLSLCALGNYDECRQLLVSSLEKDKENHLALGAMGHVLLVEGDANGAVEYLQQAIAVKPSYAGHHVSLGNAYWMMGDKWQQDKQYAYASWISAAKLDPSISEAFSGLGKWYQQHGNDTDRAKKCFVKAVDLNRANGDAGKALAEMYLAEGSDDLCEELLVKATEAKHDQQWAWKSLGFLLLRQDNHERAIVAFRNSLSLDRTDVLCWEGLCESYMAIGRMGTSVKVAKKIVELDPGRVSGHWLCARACLLANDPEASLGYFESAAMCASLTEFVPDLQAAWTQSLSVGRAECLVACAEKWYSEGLLGRVIDSSNAALEALLIHVAKSGGESCSSYLIWSLISVACTWILRAWPMLETRADLVCSEAVQQLADGAEMSKDQLAASEYLDQVTQTAAREVGQFGACDGYIQRLFVLAQRSACQRVLVAPSATLAASAWADLGSIYYDQSTRLSSPMLHTNESSVGDGSSDLPPLLDAAMSCALAAIQLDSSNAGAYNLQGLVAAHTQQAALAQHAFIMASRRSPGSGLPWANLGFLYLHNGDIELANKSFSRTQMADPEFVPGWLGQAMIAETLGSAEAIELFETCLLSVSAPKPIADYGYARQVWKMAVERNSRLDGKPLPLQASVAKSGDKPGNAVSKQALSFSEQSRLVLGIYAARRYVAQAGDDGISAGAHLLGMLLEQNGEYESAAEAYLAAYAQSAAEGNGTAAESARMRQWVALAHLGRAQCGAGQFDEATESYSRASDLLSAGVCAQLLAARSGAMQLFYFTLGHSIALFFAQRLEESLGMFEQTLAQSEDVPELRPFVAVMLAQVLWALGTDEHRALARQHLLEVMSEQSVAFLPGLLTLFAMGLLQGDGDLVAATYPELVKARSGDLHHDVVRLEAHLALLREDQVSGRRALAKALHKNPSDASLWLLLAKFETLGGDDRKADASMAAQATLQLFRQAARGHFSWSSAPSQAHLNSATLSVIVSASTIDSRALNCTGDTVEDSSQRIASRAAARRAVMYQPWTQDAWSCLQDVEAAASH
ncbi:Superkiller protein 3 [Coemansia spiralis]|uniref:Superkiller protein 3 n=1 Tax=Coemansia spiralis TaxID=417178 RepID=A0A9W8GF90_9FUNG|nr:Superkiller protein 3 [Coemansia spiralis]